MNRVKYVQLIGRLSSFTFISLETRNAIVALEPVYGVLRLPLLPSDIKLIRLDIRQAHKQIVTMDDWLSIDRFMIMHRRTDTTDDNGTSEPNSN